MDGKTFEEVLERFRRIDITESFDMIVAVAQRWYRACRDTVPQIVAAGVPAAAEFARRMPQSSLRRTETAFSCRFRIPGQTDTVGRRQDKDRNYDRVCKKTVGRGCGRKDVRRER